MVAMGGRGLCYRNASCGVVFDHPVTGSTPPCKIYPYPLTPVSTTPYRMYIPPTPQHHLINLLLSRHLFKLIPHSRSRKIPRRTLLLHLHHSNNPLPHPAHPALPPNPPLPQPNLIPPLPPARDIYPRPPRLGVLRPAALAARLAASHGRRGTGVLSPAV